MESKKDIRKRVLMKRDLLSAHDWGKACKNIFEKVTLHPFFLNAEEIYCYVDYRNEVETKHLIGQAWKCGKKVAVPKVNGAHMDFFYIQKWEDLKPGYANILEPVTNEIATGKNVLVVMPGAAFDKNRHRIGYGKGFYDRYMALHPDYHSIAIAFELQMVECIPADKYDICPEVIITEERIYV